MPDETITLELSRALAERLYDVIGETPHSDAWTWPIHVALADALGYHVPAWVREKAAQVSA